MDDANLDCPQSKPLQGMQQHHDSGFSYVVDDFEKFKRFVFLNVKPIPVTILCITTLIESGRGHEILDFIIDLSQKCAPSENNVLAALCECAMYQGEAMYDETTTLQKAAWDSLVTVCNIPSKLFRFLQICYIRNQKRLGNKTERKANKLPKGKMVIKGISKFYTDPNKSALDLLYLLTKYSKRYGWDHKKLLNRTHSKNSR